jgi:hypothetical protein
MVMSLLPNYPGWLFPSAESPMVGADVKPQLSCQCVDGGKIFWSRGIRAYLYTASNSKVDCSHKVKGHPYI